MEMLCADMPPEKGLSYCFLSTHVSNAMMLILQLLQRQAMWFLSMRLQAKHFLFWKQALGEAKIEQEKSCLALWHWSLNLQRKVLLTLASMGLHGIQ
jgi:hypothetical protein